jgi:hypothetical protein
MLQRYVEQDLIRSPNSSIALWSCHSSTESPADTPFGNALRRPISSGAKLQPFNLGRLSAAPRDLPWPSPGKRRDHGTKSEMLSPGCHRG